MNLARSAEWSSLTIEYKGLTVGIEHSGASSPVAAASNASTAALDEASGVESGVDEVVGITSMKDFASEAVNPSNSKVVLNELALASRKKGLHGLQ